MTRLVALSHTGLHSGAERVLGRVLAAALADGWDVRCCVPDGPFADDLRAAGIPVVEVPDLKLPGGPRPLAALRLLGRARRASRILRAQGRTADVVLVNGLLGLPAARLARLRVPVVWLVHDIVRRRDWRALLRAVGYAPSHLFRMTLTENLVLLLAGGAWSGRMNPCSPRGCWTT